MQVTSTLSKIIQYVISYVLLLQNQEITQVELFWKPWYKTDAED